MAVNSIKKYFYGSVNNPNSLGQFLRNKRKEDGLTMKQVENITGIGQSTLSFIERGQFRCPSIDTLERIAPYYGVSVLEMAKMIDLPNATVMEYIAEQEAMNHE